MQKFNANYLEMFYRSARAGGAIAIILSFTAFVRAFQATEPEGPSAAQASLYTARYEIATDLYRKELAHNPAWSEGYYGLVRALLRSHHAEEAYKAAEEGMRNAPNTAGAETAAGLASFRRGDLEKAERHFRAALKLDPKYSGALAGLASIYSTISKFKTARDLRLQAYSSSPADPELMLVHANTLTGAAHLAALEEILKIYDPSSEPARNLRVHIQNDRAFGDRKLRRLTSPYQAEHIKLQWLWSGPKRVRGAGLRVQINGKQTVTLLLDTGASGIALSPKTAEKAGLEKLNVDDLEAKGIGDESPGDLQHYIASEVRIGNVAFSNYPVAIFRSARDADIDGLIGADVFDRFFLTIDFPGQDLALEPRQQPGEKDSEPVEASDKPPEGFHRALRAGDHLAIYTYVNEQPPRLFLIDSGASTNLIDVNTARESTSVYGTNGSVRGVQGKVKDTSVANRVSLVFAGFRQDNSSMLSFNFDKISESHGFALSGIIGFPILSQLKVSIDYREGNIHFERGK